VAQELSPEEKDAVKTFLNNLVAQSGFASRRDLAFAAGLSELGINEWLSPKGSLPSALNLLRLLQATDALNEPFRTFIPTRHRRSDP
jgi:transcriptional regulator with XRE-family HTH domain